MKNVILGLTTCVIGAAVASTNEKELAYRHDLETNITNVTGKDVADLYRLANDTITCPNGASSSDCERREELFNHIFTSLDGCENPLAQTNLSIGHRGASLIYPEHSKEGYEAALRHGAGYIECDVAVTKDGELVCRHDNCDLATTTNILLTALADKCTETNDDGVLKISCCTYDLTAEEFFTLEALMDGGVNATAESREYYRVDPPPFRSTLYEPGTLMSHKESAELIVQGGAMPIPELKTCDEKCEAAIGMEATAVAAKLAEEVAQAVGEKPGNGVLQTFDLEIALHWKKVTDIPVCYLWGTYRIPENITWDNAVVVAAEADVEYLGAPLYDMVDAKGALLVESILSKAATELSMLKTPWTLERSYCAPDQTNGGCDWYYTGLEGKATFGYSDTLLMMYTLVHELPGFVGAFSDYPLTMSAFANCVPKIPTESPTNAPTTSPVSDGSANPTVSPTTSPTTGTSMASPRYALSALGFLALSYFTTF